MDYEGEKGSKTVQSNQTHQNMQRAFLEEDFIEPEAKSRHLKETMQCHHSSPYKSPGRAVRLPENRLSHGTPGKVKFLTKFRIVPKIKKKTEIL